VTIRDKRAASRRRVRFRSGKLAAPDGKFLSDCQIYDRSAEGARLRLEASAAIPEDALLFDDERNSLSAVAVAWRRANELGIRFMMELDTPASREIAKKLSGKYYAI
jgi:hypothetical protein